jgi:TRAP-type C4-dicarboxylate transport system permease small subunit
VLGDVEEAGRPDRRLQITRRAGRRAAARASPATARSRKRRGRLIPKEDLAMRRVESILANVFGAIFVLLSFIVTIETISRKVFDFSIQGADELGGYSLAIGGVISFTLALVGRNHIRVDVFHELMGTKVKAALNWLSIVLLAFFAITLVVVCATVIRETLAFGSTAQTPWATPLIYPQSVWYAGLVMFMLCAVVLAVRATWLLAHRRIDELNVEFHPKSAREELKEELDDLAQRNVPSPAPTAMAQSGAVS